MLGDGVIALFFALGVGTWVYNQFMKHTMNVKNSVVGAFVVGLVGFIFVYTLLKYVLGW